jgi:3D-(3,5/4)-trihydroxycyclohexane-1,2-dione acylhydrolase (decyclizing)
MSKAIRLTVGQALVQFVANQYVERDGRQNRFIEGIWGIFGHGNVSGLGQGIVEFADKCGLKFYRPQHEQGMVHIAAAFAKHRNRLSTFACTTSIGPGALNMVTGAGVATVNRLPVLLLPSDYFANRVPDPVLQQIEHPMERDVSASDAFRPVSRFFDRISRPEQLLAGLPEAFRILTDPVETGAVTVSLPEDVQAEAFDWPEAFFEKRVWHVRRPVPEPELLQKAMELIKRAKRPIVISGGGTIYSDACEELRKFCDEFCIPLTETQAGKGVLEWNYRWNAGPIGSNGAVSANQLAKETDLIIALGTRLTDFTTASRTQFENPAVRLIGINVTPMDASKLSALPLVADAKRALVDLTTVLKDAGYQGVSEDYRAKVSKLKEEWDKRVTEIRTPKDNNDVTEIEAIGLINEAAGGKATVVCAAGNMPGELLRLWRPDEPKAYHLEYGFSCMGYEIPGGIGVKLAEPERDVVVMIGDGTYLMMNSEIVTAVAEGLTLTIVVIDNHGYQCILGLQRICGVSDFGNELRFRNSKTGMLDGDFVKHAEAMGAHATLAQTADEITAAIKEAKQRKGVSVVLIPVDPEKRMPPLGTWWDVPVAEVSGIDKTRQTREKYEKVTKKQRTVFA